MRNGFVHNLLIVTIVHTVTVLILVLMAAVQSCRQSSPAPLTSLRVDLVVRPLSEDAAPSDQNIARSDLVDIPKPPEEELRKQKPLVQVQVSGKLIRRDNNGQAPKLSANEIEKDLRDAVPAHTDAALYTDDAIYEAVVQQTFRDAWSQPSYSDVGDAVAVVSIRLGKRGVIVERKLARGSGNAILDASVKKAVDSVDRIAGLSANFVARHATIMVSFKVEE